MAQKALTVRIDEKAIKKMDYFRNEGFGNKMSQSDFIQRAIENECERIRLQRDGGMELRVPNPNKFIATEEQKMQQILNLSKLSNVMAETCVALDPGIDHIKAFYKDRLITDTEDIRDKFDKNFYDDLSFLNSLDEK